MDHSFEARFRPLPGSEALALDLSGDLSKETDETLFGLHEWDSGLPGGAKYLILNFTSVPYINSLGIAVLIRLVRSGIKAGYLTFAYGLSAHYQKLFRMVGLAEHLMVYPDEYAVLQRIEML